MKYETPLHISKKGLENWVSLGLRDSY